MQDSFGQLFALDSRRAIAGRDVSVTNTVLYDDCVIAFERG